MKMIGDYCRYGAENSQGVIFENYKTEALKSYEEGAKCANDLPECNPSRLGIALNFSVFYYEVINDSKKAIEIGEKALQDAVEKLDECDEE
mmetsp:Transcript_34518/g.33710  ORF Transcript_34518/g.33710 Transcript_34518/m.33710 type:complete len:91 (+) Transcript_34518:356-628(+)